MADLLAEEEFADLGIITLDWEGDGITPVMVIEVVGWYKEWAGQPLVMEPWIIDMEDAFSRDNMDNGILRLMVVSIRDLFNKMVDERRRKG